jgi:hypothetical protein
MKITWFRDEWHDKPDWIEQAERTVDDIWRTSYRGESGLCLPKRMEQTKMTPNSLVGGESVVSGVSGGLLMIWAVIAWKPFNMNHRLMSTLFRMSLNIGRQSAPSPAGKIWRAWHLNI